jgi:hypothetical protein
MEFQKFQAKRKNAVLARSSQKIQIHKAIFSFSTFLAERDSS